MCVKCLLYADDQVIIAPSACELHIVTEMNDSVKKRGMKLNVSETKFMLPVGAPNSNVEEHRPNITLTRIVQQQQ
ncbi:hypothetical protein EVAR_68858_1 [Eumeta japonica]|uniref:Reverse transcriptase domain-containing protein n=1 Tax=Eumeta variegata TaxID=151549 RepID=A0A4C1ZB68_EUMVA|nr:hypothetical protein EVAR_68858_1 [Eumeta japonica]